MKRICYLLIIFALGCSDIIGVEDISNRTVTVLAPTNETIVSSTTVNFSWNVLEDVETYKLQIASPNFETSTTIVEDTGLTDTNYSATLVEGDYEWRVRGENSDYQTAYVTQSFTVIEGDVIDISSSEVILLAPADNLAFATTDTINFSWETVLNSDNYTFQIATPTFANATEIIENDIVNTTSFSISNLDAQDYEWRVKAQNSEFQTNYTTQSFTIEE